MKKIIYLIIGLSLITLIGCQHTENTPTKQVEKFLSKYQTLDKDVLEDLDDTVDNTSSFNEQQKEDYRKLMKNHYKNLKYEIKDEMIDGNRATVVTEIEVNDYSKILKKAEEYRKEYPEKFNDNNKYDEQKFISYKIDLMKNADETIKYTLELNLTKDNNKNWVLDAITADDEQKINGTYRH